MRSRTFGPVLWFVWLFAILWGCSSDSDGSVADPVADPPNPCESSSQDIVERLDRFLEPFSTLAPEEFLASQEIAGLDDFQADVGAIIAGAAQPAAGGCGLERLQATLDEELQRFAGKGLLADFVIESIRTGGQRATRDVAVKPDDNLPAILALLDTGSSMTLAAGTYEIETTLLIRTGVTLVGAGKETTLINSSASDAAVAVFGGASLVMRDLSIAHTGSAPASVLVAFASSVDLDGIRLTGAVSSDEGAGGGGMILSATNIDGTEASSDSTGGDQPSASQVVITVSDSDVSDNAVAGIAVTSDLAPTLIDNVIARNGACGICYFDAAAGRASGNTIEANAVGIQTSDQSAPEIFQNILTKNTSSGLVIDGASTPVVFENTLEENGEVGIEIQGAANPEIRENTFAAHPLALSIGGTSTALVHRNIIKGADVGLQLVGQAAPLVSENELFDSVIAAVLHREDSAGTFTSNAIMSTEGVGIFVEASSAPILRLNTIDGGEVGISYTGSGAGILEANTFRDQDIGIDVSDDAAPQIQRNKISGTHSAGAVFRSQASGVFRDNSIIDPGTIGVQLAGSGNPLIEQNMIDGGETGAALIEATAARLIGNTFIGQQVGIQVSGSAVPTLDGNQIEDSTRAGITYHDDSAGVAERNTILNPSVIGIQISGSAHPALATNIVFVGSLDLDDPVDSSTSADDVTPDDSAPAPTTDDVTPDDSAPAPTTDDVTTDDSAPAPTVGLLYGGTSSGTALGNQLLGQVIGIQVGESATPTLVSNFVDGGDLGGVGVIYGEDAAGEATANRTANHLIGFQLSGTANPVMDGNVVQSATDAAFLLRESAAGSLTNNECPTGIPGIALIEQASPSLGENECVVVRG